MGGRSHPTLWIFNLSVALTSSKWEHPYAWYFWK